MSFEFEAFRELVTTRRTIGAFRPELVPDEHVLEAIELATWAPNHRKTEPWRFTLPGPNAIGKIIELNQKILAETKGQEVAEAKGKAWRQFPGWLVMTCRRSDDALLQQEDLAACACAAQTLMLALWGRGIGTKWATGEVTRRAEFSQILGYSSSEEMVVGLFWYGYPAVTPVQTRSPVSSFIRRIS